MKAKTEEITFWVRAECSDLPGIRFGAYEPVRLGIQKGKEVVDVVSADASHVTFVPEFRAKQRPDGTIAFLGPYAHGPTNDRFFYLSWGVPDRGGEFEMFRRLKIRLGHLTWSQLQAASKKPIVVRLSLTDANGCPLCATPPASNIEWVR